MWETGFCLLNGNVDYAARIKMTGNGIEQKIQVSMTLGARDEYHLVSPSGKYLTLREKHNGYHQNA